MAMTFPLVSFLGGEWDPSLHARVDLAKYRISARKLKNAIPTIQGGVKNRAGTGFVANLDPWCEHKLIPFVFSNEQAYLLVLEADQKMCRMRVIKDGAEVIDPTTMDALNTSTFTWEPDSATGCWFLRLATASGGSYDPSGSLTIPTYGTTRAAKERGFEAVLYGSSKAPLLDCGLSYDNPGAGLVLAGPALKWNRQGTTDAWYITALDGSNPHLSKPATVRHMLGERGLQWKELDYQAITSLVGGTVGWGYGDPGSLGYSTIVVNLGGTDPSTKDRGWIEAAYTKVLPKDAWAYGWAEYSGSRFKTIWVNPAEDPTTVSATDYLVTAYKVIVYGDLPYKSSDIHRVTYIQDADTLLLFHPSYNPRRITRASHTSWTIEDLPMASDCNAYTGGQAAPGSAPTVTKGWEYINGPGFRWEQSTQRTASGTWYFLTEQNGRSPYHVVAPASVRKGTSVLTRGSAAGNWEWGDFDNLGFETIYVQDSTDPDSQPQGTFQAQWQDQKYVATAVSQDGEESLPSAEATAGTGGILTPPATTGADHFNLYRKWRGFYAWVGTDSPLSRNIPISPIEPDASKGPPQRYGTAGTPDLQTAAGYRPGKGVFFQQRLVLARTDKKPTTLWGSQVGFIYNFLYSVPPRDDDAFSFTLASEQMDEIVWLAFLGDLLVGTKGGEYRISPEPTRGAITPSSVYIRSQSSWGSKEVQPEVVGRTLFFVQRGGIVLRAMAYNLQADGFQSSDVSVWARHLFEGVKLLRHYVWTPSDDRWVKNGKPLEWVNISSTNLWYLKRNYKYTDATNWSTYLWKDDQCPFNRPWGFFAYMYLPSQGVLQLTAKETTADLNGNFQWTWGQHSGTPGYDTVFIYSTTDPNENVDIGYGYWESKKAVIKRLAYQVDPEGILWVLTESGELRGLLFSEEQQALAWFRVETRNGLFMDEAVVPSADGTKEDLYVVVRRETAGNQVTKKLEMFLKREPDPWKNLTSFNLVDCAVTVYAWNNPVSEVWSPGLIDGETYSIVYYTGSNIRYKTGLVCKNGKLSLPEKAKFVRVGLPVSFEVETNDLALLNEQGSTQDKLKKVDSVLFSVADTYSGLLIGTSGIGESDFSRLEFGHDPTEQGTLFTGLFEGFTMPHNVRELSIIFKTAEPIPVHVRGLYARISGGMF